MSKLKLICSCGAALQYDGPAPGQYEQRFYEHHESCKDQAPARQLELVPAEPPEGWPR